MNKILTAFCEKYKTRKSFREFVRFCIVGGICSVIDWAIFYGVRTFASYLIAVISGYCLSLIVNYFLTVYWTFQQKANKKNAVGIVGAHMFNLFCVRLGLMTLFVEVVGWPDSIAYIPTFAISVVTNFCIVKYIVTKL